MARFKAIRLAVLVAFAAGAVACGEIEAPLIMALEEGSSMDVWINPEEPTPILLGTVDLEGGVETLMTAEFGLFDLMFKRPVVGTIEVIDLLFGGTPFSILGIPTEEVCTVPDPNGVSGGSVVIDIFDHRINNASLEFVIDMATAVKVGNPLLAGAIPDGLPMPLTVDSEADLSLGEMLQLLSGDAEGTLTIVQELDEVFVVDLLGLLIPMGITGELTLTSVNEFPTGPLLDDCIALLGL